MKFKIQTIIISATFTSLMVGCSSLTYKKDAEKTAKIKKVAIVAFASLQPKTSGENMLSALMESHPHDLHTAMCEHADYLKTAGKIIEESLSKNAGFEVVPMETTGLNPMYKDYQEKMRGSGITMLIPGGSVCYNDSRIFDYYRWPRLKLEDVKKIKTALNVDAVLRVLIQSELNATTVMGVAVGGAKTQVRLNVEMYNGIDKDPIWYDTNAQGDEVAEGTTSVLGFSDRNKLNQKTLIGSQSAAQKLVERYKKGKG